MSGSEALAVEEDDFWDDFGFRGDAACVFVDELEAAVVAGCDFGSACAADAGLEALTIWALRVALCCDGLGAWALSLAIVA